MSLFFNAKWAFFKWCNPTCPLSRVEPSPSGGQRACSRLSPSGPWLIVRGTDHLYSTPLHSLGGCNVVWFVSFWVFSPLLFVSLLLQCYSDILYPFVADSRATARTTETLSHAASRRKKLTPEWFSRLWLTRPRRTICLWICLITLFSLLAWSLMMNVFVLSQHGICPFRVVSADWSANGSEYVSWQLADKKKFKCLFNIYWNHLFISAPKSCHLSTIYPFCIQPSSKSFLLPKFCEHHPKQMSRKYDAAKRSYSKQLERSWSWNMWSGTRKVMQLEDNKVKKLEKIQIAGTVIGHNELTTNPGMLAWRGLTTQREGRFNGFPKFQKTCHENFRPSFLIGWLSQSFLFNCSSFSSFCEDSSCDKLLSSHEILGFSLHHTKITILLQFQTSDQHEVTRGLRCRTLLSTAILCSSS